MKEGHSLDISPSHDATHDMKRFPGKEHGRPEDDSYENRRKREPGKTFTPLEEMQNTNDVLNNPEFVTEIRGLRAKIEQGELNIEKIDMEELAREYGVEKEDIEYLLRGGADDDDIPFRKHQKSSAIFSPEARLGEPTPQSGSTANKDTRGKKGGWWGMKTQDKRYRKPPANRPPFKTRFARPRKEAEQARESLLE